MLNQFLNGAIFFGAAVVGVFFLRFWKKSHDALFLLFAVAFELMAVERLVLAFLSPRDEFKPYVYLIRLTAFVVILAAILHKNRGKRGP